MTKYSKIWANGRRNLTKLFIGSLRASWAFKNQIKSIHWVNISARSSFFEKHIILTKPFQPARADISCSFFEKHIIVQNFLLSEWALLDVLCRQQIKLFQVVSTSEFHEYWWNDLENIFLVPAAFCRASEARTQSRP